MHVLDSLLGLIAPHSCLVCEQDGSLLCDMCADSYLEPVPPRCYRCLNLSTDSEVCRLCRKVSRIRHVWVATDYDGVAKQLASALKFERARAAATVIATHMADTLPYFSADTVITFVPTATSRERQRGYDQSRLIAKEIARIKKCQFAPLLGRTGQTRQVGAARDKRVAQMKASLYPLPSEISSKLRIVLVDDIVTTGASIEAGAAALKSVGARHVSAAVFAQKQ